MREKKERKPLSKTSKIIISIVTIFCIAGLSALLWYGFGYVDPDLSKPLVADEFYSTWMSNIKGDTQITNVVMPGSHDSGCNGMMPQAMTQGHDIKDQLKGGVRYFDTRVTNKGSDLVIFHGPVKGQKFSKVLNEHKEFILNNPSEFIILDFQHLGDKVHSEIISMIKDIMPMDKMLKASKYSDVTTVTFDTLRTNGINFMIVWKADNGTEVKEAKDNDFYTRNDSLRSEYDGKIHRKGDEELIAKFNDYYNNHESEKLFVLQAQRTCFTPMEKPSEYEKKFAPKVNEFILSIKDNAEILAKTNIIMRDFVVSDMNNVRYILRLNTYKGLVKEEKLNLFNGFVKD